MLSCCKDKCQDYEMWTGLLLFIVGAVFLLQRFDLIPAETWYYLWPILLLVVGVKLMISGGSCHSCCEASMAKSAPSKSTPKAAPAKKAPAKKRRVAKK